jgi:hypothetical protein
VTRLRQMMLDELERRNYTQNARRASWQIWLAISTAHPISLGSITSENTQRIYFERASSNRTASACMWRRCGFSS